ncbi:hypothetical protein DDE83_008564 [Stemphylium lycopersici]|uniref:BTB domain-containing protein n=1 Tax=Stemphylium lycopersici TaxID=183478 RepID=A0A364MT16_STELY|nr:hypothetical protein DDE83_008564 [Stemphylium lycopersici]
MLSVARGKVVAIAVGPQKKLYYIHKDLICHHSEYFRTAYSGRWKDSDEGVALEDVEVEVFNIFVHWLYAQDLPRNMASVPRIAEVNVSLVSPRRKPASYSDWCPLMLKSSAFGNRFLAREFQRLTHNMFVDGHFMDDYDEYTVSNYKDIIWAFDNLAADNTILSLMVDLQCLEWGEKYDNAEERLLWPQLPHEFLLRVMRKHDIASEFATGAHPGHGVHISLVNCKGMGSYLLRPPTK